MESQSTHPMKWTNADVLKFIEAYRSQPCIWNPNHTENKSRNSVALAWQNILDELQFDCTVNDLKRKRESLMATFRMLYTKHLKLKQSGNPSEPQWFAYEAMERFLGPIYNGRCSAKLEAMVVNGSDVLDEIENFKIEDFSSTDTYDLYEENEEIPIDTPSSEAIETPNTIYNSTIATNQSNAIPDIDKAEKCMEEAYQILKDVTKLKRKSVAADEDNDECQLYAQLLSKKLRKFSEEQREEIMFEIDGLLIRKRKEFQKQNRE